MILYCADHDEQFDTDTDVETHLHCHDTEGRPLATPRSWAPEFKCQGEWCGNAQRFATEQEAYASATVRFRSWTVPTDYRVVRSYDPANYTHSEGKDSFIEKRGD